MDSNINYSIIDPVLTKRSRKLEIATGMNVTAKYASTQYQITNYGLAGLCELHIDPHGYLEGAELTPGRSMLKKSGDMMATVMGWMEEEPVGGATAFIAPHKEVTLWPQEGSAAFWFNLDKKGFRDRRTKHGGCPVLGGSKWIVNKWIHYFDQMFKHPCTLDSTRTMEAFADIY